MSAAAQWLTRSAPPEAIEILVRAGLHPLLARVCAARGISTPEELAHEFDRLIAPEHMYNLPRMAQILADAIAAGKKLLIVADYDADGATACAVGLRALRAFGAAVDYLVPNRFEYGYGLTPEIVRLAREVKHPDIVITVDNGIASIDGVDEANRLGLEVLITDHHLPGEELPRARCIINPNQPGCGFPSKSLAGVGVMFYLMLALRAELRSRGAFGRETGPNLAALLDLVALGTVADVVRLDQNNRILVHQGLERIRAGRLQPGVAALFRVAGRDPHRVAAYDLAFVLAPRLNAAGRLADMAVGIECLATDDAARATAIAFELDHLNRERRALEADMQASALAAIESRDYGDSASLCLFDPAWHPGVVGIVAARIKDRFHRPTIAFARSGENEIRGSGRSIRALNLRDALDLTAKRHPRLLAKFGGHAAAAGLTLRESDFGAFAEAFERTVQGLLTPADLDRQIETDGSLPTAHATLEAAAALDAAVWGQGFPAPRFDDQFEVAEQRVVGERHLKLKLARDGCRYDAMLFGHSDSLPRAIRAAYRFGINEFNGAKSLQFTIEHWAPA
ncbi:MAG: single-stranded-DNA-specific exonuclease RecJ [Betaproteobacteria bacterium]|nr:single-stranded-DNA-specific exonuclease RecJ [Betaproteobacteria bacterium]